MDKITSILMIAMCLAGLIIIAESIVDCIGIYLERAHNNDWTDDEEES